MKTPPPRSLKSLIDMLEEPWPGEPLITVDAGRAPAAEVDATVAAPAAAQRQNDRCRPIGAAL